MKNLFCTHARLPAFCVLLFCLQSMTGQAQYSTFITVAQDGSGDFTHIQEAIDNAKAFPDKRITIFIKPGVYKEKIKVPACNTMLTLKGGDRATTIITWDDHFNKIGRGRNSTFYTATLLVQADDFRAEHLTIENTAGPIGQAVALAIEADRCVVRNCWLLGNQDTLYTAGSNSRQYFVHCHIEGTTDFIFGAATALFDSCTIHSKSNSFITAASTPQGNAFGYVFRYCRLSASPGIDSVFLGRPWREFARVAFLYCEIGTHILPEGWSNWQDTERDKTAFYREYKNFGPGAGVGRRVVWSHLLTKKEARRYSRENVLAARPAPENREKYWFGE